VADVNRVKMWYNKKVNIVSVLLGGAAGLAGAYALSDYLNVGATKDLAFERAVELSNGRGIINLGAGPHRFNQSHVIAEAPEVLANVDAVLDGLPHFVHLDIEREPLPFADKSFGCAFASHVLEHLDNWQFALAEASRVADHVVVVLPHPDSLSGLLSPEHKQHFSVDDIMRMSEIYPVEVYY